MKRKCVATILITLTCAALCFSGIVITHNRKDPLHTSNGSLPLTDIRETFTFLLKTDTELQQLCDGNLNNSFFYQELEERTNIHIDWLSSLDTLKVRYRFNQDTENIPDLISINCFTEVYGNISLDEAIDNGDILDLTELVPKYAPNYYRIIQKPSLKHLAYTEEDRIGSIYSIKQESQKPWAGLQIRKDWLDELNLDIPVTYKDWEIVLTAFKEEKGASAPFTLPSIGYTMDDSINAGFQVGHGFFQIDGEVRYGPCQDEWLEYLTLMNRWYQKGLIDPNYMTDSSSYCRSESILSGSTGAWYGMYTLPSTVSKSDPSIEIVAVKPPRIHEEDKLHIRSKYSVSDNALCITSACQNPGLALQWIDYLFSEEGSVFANYGVEDETYRLDKNGNPVFTDQILNNPDGLSFTQALKMYTFPPGLPSAYLDWKREFQSIPPSDIIMCDVWNSTASDYMLPSDLSFTSKERTRLSEIMEKAGSCMQNYTTTFITGITPLSDYRTYLEKMEEYGIDEAVQIYQQAYERYLSK